MQPVSRLLGSAVTVNGAPYTIDIDLAASATTDGMDITVTVKDIDGSPIEAVHRIEWWISEAATGVGLTADTYSGDVTTVSNFGREVQEVTSKKHFVCLTNAAGVFKGLAVDSANPVDQYIAVLHPLTGKAIVSEASGTNWEGA